MHPQEAETLPISILKTFYSGVVKSILTYCISTWYCSMSEKKALQRIVRGAERIIRLSKNIFEVNIKISIPNIA